MHNSLTLLPINKINGTITVPGSKSISNRVLLLSAMSSGKTKIVNLPNNEDVNYMINALNLLGVKCTTNNNKCIVSGIDGPLYSSNQLEIFLKDTALSIRLLTAALCVKKNDIILTGSTRLKQRPIGCLIDSLRQGKARIDYLRKVNYPPIRVCGGFIGGRIEISGLISSQFLSALLIITPLSKVNSVITVNGNLISKPYIDMTLNLMRIFSITVKHHGYHTFYIKGCQSYKSPGEYIVESDASSASYFLAAAAIKGGTVKITGIGKKSVQGDTNFLKILKSMEAYVELEDKYISCTYNGKLKPINIDMCNMPDVAMTIAITALFADGITTIVNISSWKIKESNRLLAMVIELRKVGAVIKFGKDFICITPPLKIRSSIIETYNDHRIAMCFSLLSLSNTYVTIKNPKCVNKTFPNYFDTLSKISTKYY